MRTLFRFLRCLVGAWTWRMAWRDSRRSRRRLLLYTASIVLGIAALTAISSSRHQMQQAIQEQSKALLGADLVVSARDPLTAEQEEFLGEAFGGEQAREITFPSMVYFVKSEGTRLVQVRALEGEFPFYGEFETIPETAAADLREGRGALVEGSLMDLFDAKPGDLIRVGDVTLPIAGVLSKVPGETMAFGTIAPRVYLPLPALQEAGLLGEGTLARYKIYFKFAPGVNALELEDQHKPQLRRWNMSSDTVEERQRDLGRSLENMMRFLNLIGFVALLLGGVGVASGIHVHMKQKLATIATLRCLGCGVPQAFAVYFAQAMGLGLIGAVAGAGIGVVVQFVLPMLLADFMPFPIRAGVSWPAVGTGMWIGFLICLLFALLPLLPIRKISPLAALRSTVSHETSPGRDPLVWLAYAVIAAGLVLFGILQNRDWEDGVAYAAAIAGAFLVLAGAAWLISRIAKLVVHRSWPFTWRQGLSNLYRPNNRTILLMVSLGMGTFLVLTLYLVQANLLNELLRSDRANEGNAVLFDIQSDQREGVISVLESQQLPVLESVPIISMRLRSIKGRSVEEIRRDPNSGIRGWALGREYRSTYRSDLSRTEKMLSGTWHSRVAATDEPIPVSLEQGIARNLRLELGDELVFDVQGVPIPARVASIREVDWRRLSPNFFVVFPLGAIEEAPAMHMIVTKIASAEQSARLQREVVRRFPNVSAVDLTLVLQTIDTVLSKISFVIRFMALFTVGTGLLVLGAAIVSGRYQRLQESILLRTLGATRRQVLQILTVEYAFLGALAAATGIVLATAAAWGLSVYIFKMKFGFHPWPLIVALLSVSLLTVVAGLLGNRGILQRPPLEVLRVEG